MPSENRSILRFSAAAFGVLALNVFVVVWGGLVRASGSGAGCGDRWPLCNGVVVPQSPAIHTIIEFIHRVTSGLALIAAVALCIWCFRIFPPKSQVRRASLWSVIFLFGEAALGAGLVLLRYVGANDSSGRAAYLSAHLTNTLLLLAFLTATAWVARKPSLPVRWNFVPPMLLVSLGIVLLVSVTGAITALGDTLFPARSLAAGVKQDFSATSSFLVRLRVIHPILAIIAGFAAGWAAFRILRRMRTTRNAQRFAVAVLVLVGIQLWAGGLNLALLAPVWMQLTHLLLADLLWIALVLLAVELGQTIAASPERAYQGLTPRRPGKILETRTSAQTRR